MTSSNNAEAYDYILVGGGLQGGLLALALRHHRPDATVLVIERDDQFGGNHTWSFHPGDVPQTSRIWFDPLIGHRWQQYQVRLGGFRRRVGLEYASIPSDLFADVVSKLFEFESHESDSQRSLASPEHNRVLVAGGSLHAPAETILSAASRPNAAIASQESEGNPGWKRMTNTEVIYLSENSVLTAGGAVIEGRLIIDCRGPASERQAFSECGYQKFFGFEIEVREDWVYREPVLMETLAEQQDGFHFIYTLPFSNHRVLVEDTCFSETPILERRACLAHVTKYLRGLGINDFEIVREESGVLPMPYSAEFCPKASWPLAGGYAGGWFHAATGYSLPLAVAFAEAVASVPPAQVRDAIRVLAAEHVWQSHYARFLNRLLFRLVAPSQRHRIFRRFYRVLSDQAIERFYAHRFTWWDAVRIVVGIPPTLGGLRPLKFLRSYIRGDFA